MGSSLFSGRSGSSLVLGLGVDGGTSPVNDLTRTVLPLAFPESVGSLTEWTLRTPVSGRWDQNMEVIYPQPDS